MRTLFALFLFTGLAILPCSAQLNQYKYFIVPKRFEIFKDVNQYQTSTLVKYYLNQYGYEAIYDDAIPEDLFSDKCKGVTLQLEENSSLLLTRVSLIFLDCNGREVFRTAEGSSKIKEFKEAYAECIKEAMDIMASMKYEYEGTDDISESVPQTPTQPFVETAVEEPEESAAEELIVSAETAAPISESVTEVEKVVPEKIEPIQWNEAVNENGYILGHIDNGESWVLMRTSDPSVYLAYSQNRQGIAFKQDNGWKLEYYLGDNRKEIMIRTRDQ